MADPTMKANIDAAIQNIETRISSLGKAVDLSGSDFTGEELQLPNDKPTLLLFWRKDVQKSIQHIKTIASSERFNPWGTNVLVVCISPQPAEVLAAVAEGIGKFTVLDNATSSRLVSTFAIDLVPYQVSLDKDGQVSGLAHQRTEQPRGLLRHLNQLRHFLHLVRHFFQKLGRSRLESKQ